MHRDSSSIAEVTVKPGPICPGLVAVAYGSVSYTGGRLEG